MTSELSSHLLDYCPAVVKDAAVTVKGSRALRARRRGTYSARREEFESYRKMPRSKLEKIQADRLAALLSSTVRDSRHYAEKYRYVRALSLPDLPFLEKDELRMCIDDIVIGDKKRLQASYTGGTTGAGIVVYNSAETAQARAALTDQFWAEHGLHLGRDRTAWFSGRNVAWRNDVRARRHWRTNWLWRIRYYSTFHMERANMQDYVTNLNEFRPAFFSGFPSAIAELARYIEDTASQISFELTAIFTTSETLANEDRWLIEKVFGCPVRNQYASSEGAPWICECRFGALHMDITTGVFEVLGENEEAVGSGELVVTSFLERNTPLIRYRIGDALTLSPQEHCPCGWETPMVASIDGRRTDFIEVPGRGRVFGAQIGDCVKNVTSIHSFQVGLVDGVLEVDVVADREKFEAAHRQVFLAKLRERVGDIPITLHYVARIPRRPSGKHSVIRPA